MRVILLTSVAVATLSLMPALADAQGAGGGERGGAAEKAPGRGGEGGGLQQGGAEHMAPSGGGRQGGGAAETKGAPGEKPPGRANAEPPAGGGHPGAAPNGAAKTEGKANNEGKAGAAQNDRAGESGKKAPGQNATGQNTPGKEGARETGGKSVKVSSEQRTKIQTTIRSEHVESLHNVTFAVSVGTLVPERYHYHPLPPSIIEFVPEFRGYDYVLVSDEIIIIEPGTRRIVEIIE